MPSPPSPDPNRSGAGDHDSYLDHLSRGVDAVAATPWIVLIPLVTALAGAGRIDDVIASDRVLTLTFGLPTPVPDLWAFLNAGSQVSVSGGGVRTIDGGAIGLLLVGAVLNGALGAGLLGVLAGVVGDGDRPSFLVAVRRHFVPVFAYEAAVALGVLLVALLAVASGGSLAVVLVGILLGLAALYVGYGTPFIAVTHGYGFGRSLRRSVSLCGTGPYVGFTVGYALTVLACSPVVSALAYADGLPTLVMAALVAAPVGTVLAGAATSFFASLDE